jgi:hypothetical protein
MEDKAAASAVSRFLGLFVNNWQSCKLCIFKALASAKRPFQREVEVTKLLGASVITWRNNVVPRSY